jgi:hypothetical protein
MKIEIEEEKLQELLNNFYEVCSICDELNIYEHVELDSSMQEMKEYVDKNFGRELENTNK